MKEIIVEIDDKTGEVTIETKGYKGKACIEETKFLKKALGEVVKENKKSEYFQKETKNISQQKKRGY